MANVVNQQELSNSPELLIVQDDNESEVGRQNAPEALQQHEQGFCLQCRQVFKTNAELQSHMGSACWASFNQRVLPSEWTPALRNYVVRALDRVNAKPDLSNFVIMNKILDLVEANRRLKVPIDWNTAALPQENVVPMFKALPKNPRPRPAKKVEPVWVERSYPEAYYADGAEHPVKELFNFEDGKPFIANRDPREMLVFIDGACSHQGKAGAQAGSAFVFRCSDGIPRPWNIPKGAYCINGAYFFRLEDVGPTGQLENQTSLRAELRAAVAALFYFCYEAKDLEFLAPKAEATLVIATDSTYVVDGATKWCRTWEYKNKWKLSSGSPVKNQDLWEMLLRGVRELEETRCKKVYFWQIPKEQNETADRMAKYAATLENRPRYGIPAPWSVPTLIETFIELEATTDGAS